MGTGWEAFPAASHLADQTTNLFYSYNFTMELSTMMPFQQNHTEHIERPIQNRFSPYDFNGGTVLAIAGDDFAVIASDTRLMTGFSILSRDVPKTTQYTSHTVVGSCGF